MKTVKFDPEAWVQAQAGNSIPCGRFVHIKLAVPGTVEVDIGKGYRLVGYGEEMKITLPVGGRIRSPNADIAVYADYDVSVEPSEAPFTNFDKRPGGSSVERMIQTAMREAELKRIASKQDRARANFQTMELLKEKGIIDEHDVPDPDYVPPPSEDGVVETPADQAGTGGNT